MTDARKDLDDRKDEVRKVGQYILGETLGKGGYSWVKKGIDEKTSHPVALKFMTRAEKTWEKEQAEQVRTEIKSLIRINSPHVMKLYAYNLNCKYPEKNGSYLNTILLVLEYCPGGELFDILYYTQQLDAVTGRTYFVQMMKAIKACHDVGIVHRDIKPQNLLMDGNYQLKLTDFGLSFLGKDETSADGVVMKTNYVGTRGYQAPELLNKQSYKKACDVFSAGVVLFILLTGYPPFEQASSGDKWYKPLTYKPPNYKQFWDQHTGCGVDKDCQDLIAGMLAYKARNRLTLDQVMEHKWVKGKIYEPAKLAKVLKERHKETRRRRRRDKKKMTEMQNSIKVRKRAIQAIDSQAVADTTTFKKQAPVVSSDKVVHTLLNFYCKKKDINDGYNAAIQMFDMAFGSKSSTTAEEDNKWLINTVVRGFVEGKKQEFHVQCRITEVADNGEYCFKFTRQKGNPMVFNKIWNESEPVLLACLNKEDRFVFYDELGGDNVKKEDSAAEESKEAEEPENDGEPEE